MKHILTFLFILLLAASCNEYNRSEKKDIPKEEQKREMPESIEDKRKEIVRLQGEVAALKAAVNEQEQQRTAMWATWTGRIAGGLAILLGVAAFFLASYPIVGVLARHAALILGGVSVLAFLAAKFVPYLTIISIVVAIVVLGALAWAWWRDRQGLIGAVKGIEELKDGAGEYKSKLRKHIAGKTDKWIDSLRKRI